VKEQVTIAVLQPLGLMEVAESSSVPNKIHDSCRSVMFTAAISVVRDISGK
jgi:hypothetical protein